MRRWLPVLSVPILALALILAAACGGSGTKETATGGGQPSASPVKASMTIDDSFFDPKELTAKAGQPLTVELQNNGNAPHTFTIDALNIEETLDPGQKATVTLTPKQDGTMQFYCRFHRSQGMEGTLTVGSGSASSLSGPSPTQSAGSSGSGY
jgi:plastocyanin